MVDHEFFLANRLLLDFAERALDHLLDQAEKQRFLVFETGVERPFGQARALGNMAHGVAAA